MQYLRSPRIPGGPGRPPEHLDSLLRRFFRSEMPTPWPVAPKVPAPAARKLQPSRPWFRHSSRLALAAAVALFLIGYLVLAGKFPADNSPRQPSIRDEIGHKKGVGSQLPPGMPNRVNPGQVQGNLNLLPL